jgi:hypothetical protein
MTSFQDASPIGQVVRKRSSTARSIDLNQKLKKQLLGDNKYIDRF